MNEVQVKHRWKLQTQKGDDDWRTQFDSSNPITQAEFDNYRDMNMFAGHNLRVIHEVTTSQVSRSRVEPVPSPVPIA